MEHKLDEIDLRILAELSKNAKTRIHLIAKKLMVPASTVHHRIKKMEESGVIAGWSVVKDYRKMGFEIKVHVLVYVDTGALKRLKKTQEYVAEELRRIPGVEEAEVITGDADLHFTARCRGVDEWRKILLEKVQVIDGLHKTKTMLVIAE